MCEPFFSHRREQIQIAQHEMRLGDDAYRMLVLGQDFEHAPRDSVLTLGGLIRIGIGAKAIGSGRYLGFASSCLKSSGAFGFEKILVSKSRPGDKPR